jgi:hypothetical protein
MANPLSWREIPTPILFHSTNLQSLKSIQRTGLCPSIISNIVTWSVSDPFAIYVETSAGATIHWAGMPALLAILKADIPRQCKAHHDWMFLVWDRPDEVAEKGQAYAITDCGCIPPDRLWILTSELAGRRIKYRFKRLADVVVPSFPTIGEDYDHSVFISGEDGFEVDKIVKPFIRNYPRRPPIAPLAELFGVSESEMTNMLERVTLYSRKQVV